MRDKRIRLKVENFIKPFFDGPVGEELEPFYRELAERNRYRLIRLLPVFIPFFSINLIIDLFVFQKQGQHYFLFLDSIIVMVSLSFLLFILARRKHGIDRVSVLVFEACLLIWASVLSALQGSMMTLFIFVFVSAVVLYLDIISTLMVYALCIVAFFIAAMLSGSWIAFSSVEKIELVAILFWSAVAGRIMLLAKLREFRYRERVENLTRHQEEIIRRRTNDLEERLTEREVLIKEIHHRVKNNLQIIVSLSNLSLDFMDIEPPEAIMIQHRDRVLSMALAHESIYKSGSLASVSLKTYLTDVAYGLVASTEGAETASHEVHSEDLIVDLDTAIQIGLVITEVFSGFFHSPKRQGHPGILKLDGRTEGPEMVFTLRLTEKDDIEVVFPSDGLGMLLISSLTDQLGGSYSFENGGFVLRVPSKDILVSRNGIPGG